MKVDLIIPNLKKDRKKNNRLSRKKSVALRIITPKAASKYWWTTVNHCNQTFRLKQQLC